MVEEVQNDTVAGEEEEAEAEAEEAAEALSPFMVGSKKMTKLIQYFAIY